LVGPSRPSHRPGKIWFSYRLTSFTQCSGALVATEVERNSLAFPDSCSFNCSLVKEEWFDDAIMKKATRHSHFRAVSVQAREIGSFSAQESHVLPINIPTLPYGTHLPYGQIVTLRIIFWFQIMDHRNFIKEFLHYFSSLLVNCEHRCSSHRKCWAILKCGSRTFTVSIRRRKSTATTS
jgi:hypothetical protein